MELLNLASRFYGTFKCTKKVLYFHGMHRASLAIIEATHRRLSRIGRAALAQRKSQDLEVKNIILL